MEQRLSQAEADEIAEELAGLVFRFALDRLGDKWSMPVLFELCEGPRRFNEMHRGLPGISRRMLTLTLRNLERDGLVLRNVHPTTPPKVEYSQTPVAMELRHTMDALVDWAMRNRAPLLEAQAAYDERESDRTENPAPARSALLTPSNQAPGISGRRPAKAAGMTIPPAPQRMLRAV